MKRPVEMLFSMIQSILSCPFHMLPMNYVSAVIYGAPTLPFLLFQRGALHGFFTGSQLGKRKIAQFRKVIKNVRNQYLSLEGP